MKKIIVLLCALLSISVVFSSCGKKSEKVYEKPAASPPAETDIKPSDTDSNASFGQYDISSSGDDTLTVKITPNEGNAEAIETEVTYTFEGEKITSVSYKSLFPSADAAQGAAEKLKSEATYSDISVSGHTVTYNISEASMPIYEGMTRQDITALTKILNGGQ